MGKAALACVFAGALAGCGEKIGEGADPDLRGTTSLSQVFNGGPLQSDTRISATALKEKKSYHASGKLTIDGDIPEKASITVNDGKLVINGNVGDGVKLHVSQPIKTHTEYTTGWCYGYDYSSGRYEYSFKMTPRCSQTVTDGLVYDDPEPAVEIKGGAGKGVTISTPGAIVVNGREINNPGRMSPAPR
jgi:hypothetical protein